MKKRGSMTINSVISMFFVMCVIASSIVATRGYYNLSFENRELTINDYESSLAQSVCQINFYYSIEDAYLKSKDSEDFMNCFKNFDQQNFIYVFEKRYYYSDKVIINYFYDGKNINIEDDFIEFSIILNYKDKSIKRKTVKRCQILNPYKVFNIDNDYEKLDLENEEIKKLFKYLD